MYLHDYKVEKRLDGVHVTFLSFFPGLFYQGKHLKWDFSNTLLLFELKLGTADNTATFIQWII